MRRWQNWVGKLGSYCPQTLPLARSPVRRESDMQHGALTLTYSSWTPSLSPQHCLRSGALGQSGTYLSLGEKQ